MNNTCLIFFFPSNKFIYKMIQSLFFLLLLSLPSFLLSIQSNTEPIPLYLSLTNTDYHKAKREINRYTLEELSSFPQTKDLNITKFKFPYSFHITMLYIGDDLSLLETEYYKRFVEGVHVPIQLTGVIYVPGKIITGITFPDRNALLIQNKFPHVTLMVNEWQAVHSNNLMEALFDIGMPLEKFYDKMFWESKESFIKEINLNVIINGVVENVNAFVLKSGKKIIFPAVTKKSMK